MLELTPQPSNSHSHNYSIIFSTESKPKPSFVTIASWGPGGYRPPWIHGAARCLEFRVGEAPRVKQLLDPLNVVTLWSLRFGWWHEERSYWSVVVFFYFFVYYWIWDKNPCFLKLMFLILQNKFQSDFKRAQNKKNAGYPMRNHTACMLPAFFGFWGDSSVEFNLPRLRWTSMEAAIFEHGRRLQEDTEVERILFSIVLILHKDFQWFSGIFKG